MEGWVVALFVPTLAFTCLVAPVWIFMHYRSKQRAQGALSQEERDELEQLSGKAVRMLERIETLESILDQESPGWRAGQPTAEEIRQGRASNGTMRNGN
ncbi:MAG: envelope stress response membrane protein PspB [Pseudomonadales bacterium]